MRKRYPDPFIEGYNVKDGRLISYSGSQDLALIIPYPTKIICSTTGGGLACEDSAIEGFFVPLFITKQYMRKSKQRPEDALTDYFCGPKHGLRCDSGIDEQDAEFIDAILNGEGYPEITVDRGKLSYSMESWVYVTLTDNTDFCLKNIPIGPAILTWPNSD